MIYMYIFNFFISDFKKQFLQTNTLIYVQLHNKCLGISKPIHCIQFLTNIQTSLCQTESYLLGKFYTVGFKHIDVHILNMQIIFLIYFQQSGLNIFKNGSQCNSPSKIRKHLKIMQPDVYKQWYETSILKLSSLVSIILMEVGQNNNNRAYTTRTDFWPWLKDDLGVISSCR